MGDLEFNGKRLVRTEDFGFILTVFFPLAALCLVACAQAFRTTLNQAHWIAVAFFLWPLLLPPALYTAKRLTAFTAAAAVLIPLEIVCCFLAQYTLLGLDGFFVIFILWANLIPVALYLSKRTASQVASWYMLVLIALAIIPAQVRWGLRLLSLQSEATRIIAYSYDYKIRNGSFPMDLRDYSFKNPDLHDHFVYHGHNKDDKFTYPFEDSPLYDHDDKFSLRYYVASKNTAYWFSSKKGWFVEDD